MFYERFIALCKTQNIKPTAVADAIGTSRMNASRWKKGTMPSFENLRKLAEYFNVPLDYLTGTQETTQTKTRNTENIQALVSDAEIEKEKIILENFVKNIDDIPRKHRAKALDEINAFIQFTMQRYNADS